MITAPVATWIAFNTLTVVSTMMSRSPNRNVAFGLALGTSALSCALLSSGALHLFLGMELTLWLLQNLVVLLALGVMPPGSDKGEIGRISISSSIRLTAALGIWLWV
jgi:hypothetical protein